MQANFKPLSNKLNSTLSAPIFLPQNIERTPAQIMIILVISLRRKEFYE